MLVNPNITYKDILCNIMTPDELLEWYFSQPEYADIERPNKSSRHPRNIFSVYNKDAIVSNFQRRKLEYSDTCKTRHIIFK